MPAKLTPLERAKNVKLLIMDIDGVWTNGAIYHFPGPDGEFVEAKQSSAYDGMGLRWFHAAGGITGLISGRESVGVTYRAQMLGIRYVYQDCLEKVPTYEAICRDAGVTDEQVAYVGDDLPDIPLITRVGLGCAVANARPEVKPLADYTTTTPGGLGAVREVIELIMNSQGTWEKVLAKYGAA